MPEDAGLVVSRDDQLLIIAFFALIALPVLYLLRGIDNNTLTSWNWIYSRSGILPTFGFALAGMTAAFFARNSIPARFTGLFLSVLAFIAVVPLWSEPEAIIDTSRYFLQAKHLELYGPASFVAQWGKGISAWTDLPLVPFLFGVIFRVLGESRLAIQLFTTLLFSLAVVLTSLIGRRLWDREAGTSAALLLLGMPYLLVQVPLMLVDVPTLFFVTLAVYVFIEALMRGGFWIVPASAALAAAVFCKYSAGLMLLVLPLIASVLRQKGAEKVVGRSLAILFLACAVGVVMVAAKYDLFRHQLDLLRAYQLPGLSRWSESRASTFFFQMHPFIAILALLAAGRAVLLKDPTFLVPAWFGVFGLSVGRIRYLVPLFPFLAMAAAYGLRVFKDRSVRNFMVLSAVAVSLAVAYSAYLPFLNSTTMSNLKQAGMFLDRLPGSCVRVQTLPQQASSGSTEAAVPVLDLFTRKKVLYQRGSISRPSPAEMERSPLRFTWQLPASPFYSNAGVAPDCAVADISSSGPGDPVPNRANGYILLKRFARDTETFRFKTYVTIYGKGQLSQTGQ